MAERGRVKYKQIKEDLKKKIATGEWEPGDRVPSEAQLCKQYSVSRITVSRAIHDLVESGHLSRIQGKGTFVRDAVIQEGILRLTGFAERMKDKGLSLKTRLIAKEIVPVPPMMARYFGLEASAKAILLKRLRIVEGRPFCLSISYLMPEIFYWVLAEDMETESLYDLLEEKYEIRLGEATQTVQIAYLSEEEAALMDQSEEAPFLKLSLFASLADGQPAQFEESFYVGDRYVYEMHLNREV